MDLSLERIEEATGVIDPVFLDTPQFVSDQLSAELGREIVVKIETLNPIGSFKGRGTSVLARKLDPTRTWVCATAIARMRKSLTEILVGVTSFSWARRARRASSRAVRRM